MLWFLVAVLLALLVAYIVHTLLTSAGSDYTDNSFDAFVDDSPFSESSSKDDNSAAKSKRDKYRRTYDQPGKQILIIYGTEYGFSEELARELFDRVEVHGSDADQTRMQPRIVNAKNFASVNLLQESCLFVIISTAGDGVPPTDAKDFVTWLTEATLDLSHLQYSVLALGDSNYIHFCQAGKIVDQRLQELGAKCVEKRKDVDAEDEEVVHRWFGAVIKALDAMDIEPRFDYLQISESDDFDASVPSRERPFWSELKVKYNLTRNSVAGDKETIHCEFDVTDSGIKWTSGDALGIYPQNNPADVDAFLKAVQRSGSEMVSLPRWAYHQSQTTGDVLPARDALQHFYDLKYVRPELLKLLQRHASVDATSHSKQTLDDLMSDGVAKTNSRLQHYLSEREVTDVVEQFSDVAQKTNISDLLTQLKALIPRYYSISSSPIIDPSTVCVTAAVVRYQTLGKDRSGLTTTFLQDRLSVGQSCPVFVSRNPTFRLPENPALPTVMIGPGTGLAPFRAFIQERIGLEATGLNLLYFGCRQKSQDFLYSDELETWVKKGKLELRAAFSRDQPHKIYVQDLIREDRVKIWDLLSSGAHIYVCGDARHMAHDVHSALVDVLTTTGGMTGIGEAERFLGLLEEKCRYQKDTWVT